MRDQSQGDAGAGQGGGLELVGGVLFLGGCLPAAAVARAIASGTDLSAPGLGKAAKLAAVVADWVGAWPGLATSGLIAAVGALMVVGTIRREPLRYVAGAIVSGFGLAAVASGVAAGSGGQIGEGVAGLAGSVVSVIVGLAVVGVSVWLAAFASSDAGGETAAATAPAAPKEEPESIVLGLVDRARDGITALRERAAARRANRPSETAAPRAAREPRRIQTKRRKPTSAPATLGEAFTRDAGEGVSHDEAAALAPDAKALAYMENVWRNAAESFRQAEPLPPSPYPEDVRVRGGIPDGATPLAAAAAADDDEAAVAERSEDEAPESAAAAPTGPTAQQDPDVAPFDFADEFGAQAPLVGDDAPGGADDPFAGSLGAPTPLHPAEAAALEPSLRREAPAPSPGGLPDGVQYLEGYGSAYSAPMTEAGSADIPGGAQPVEPSAPPAPSWETGFDGDEYDYSDDELGDPQPLGTDDAPSTEDDALDLDAPIADVDPATGHWPRRADEGVGEGLEPESSEDEAAFDEAALLSEPGVEIAEVGEDVEPDVAADAVEQPDMFAERAAEVPSRGATDADAVTDAIEPADVDEPAATARPLESLPVDAAELDEAGPPAADDAPEEDETDAEDDEVVEYEYVDEDGNPIDASELEDGDWEEVEDDTDEEAELEDETDSEDDEDVEYEYVDEDGNPIDASELEDGEWEEVEEEDDNVAAENDEDETAELDDDDAAASTDDEEWEEAELDEPEVVIEPRPAPQTSAAATPTPGHDARLLEAGLLLVNEGRVAVSLLQKNLDVEFDEACELLDELQEAGLIGPYKNGKARDILMDADQWESRFVGA